MIESQGRQPIQSKPRGLCGIIARLRFRVLRINAAQECNRDNSLSGIAVRLIERSKWFQLLRTYASLLVQLASSRGFERLIHVHESARQRPFVRKWGMLAANQ